MPDLGPAQAVPALKLFDIIVDALQEIGVVSPGQNPAQSDVDLCRRRANLIFDSWGAQRGMVYTETFPQFTLKANHSPHTIGPQGDFPMAKRPTRLGFGAGNLVLVGNPAVSLPLVVRDAAWWVNNRVQGLTSPIPTDVYYEADWPLGQLFFWPIPSAVNNVQLELWTEWTEFATADAVFSAPQGYRAALMYSIALSVFPSFWPNKQPSAVTVAEAKKAIAAVLGQNSKCPNISLTGQGDPTRPRGDFNWMTGGPR